MTEQRIKLPFTPGAWQKPLIEDRSRSMVAMVHRELASVEASEANADGSLGRVRPFICGNRSVPGLLFGDPHCSFTFRGKSAHG
jgi:hypothetical protein